MSNESMRAQNGRYGAQIKWGRTVDRSAATAAARRNAPSDIGYWVARLDPKFAGATEQQKLDAAESLKKAYFTRLAMKSAQARRKRASYG